MDYKLGPAAAILTGGRSLIFKAETEVDTFKLWAVCSITISHYLNMRSAKLNEYSHWRQQPLVRLWSQPTRSYKQEWIAWDQWDQCLSLSKSLAHAHVWNPGMVSCTWKLSVKGASYRWWSKEKRKVSRLHKWSWDGWIILAWSISFKFNKQLFSFSVLDELHYTTLAPSMTPKILFFSLVPHLRFPVLRHTVRPVKMSSNALPVGRTLLVPCAPPQNGA